VTCAVTVGLCLLFALAWTAAWPLLGDLDTPGGDMSLRASLRDAVRHYLGTAHIDTIPDHLHRMENTMAQWIDVLNGLVAQTEAASAAQATSFSNLQGAINRQTADIAELRRLLDDAAQNAGEVTPEMQAKVTAIATALDDMKKAADTADNGFEPVETPEEPPSAPVDTPELPGDVPVDGPVVEPGTDTPVEGDTQRR
jgi:hypothetical protein